MMNFAFGLTTGIVAGIAGSFVATIVAMVVLEDSPEILKTIADSVRD